MMPPVRRPPARAVAVRRGVLLACLLLGGSATAATEFGGVVTGRETNWVHLLPALRAQGDVRWLRTAAPAAAEAGFDLVADLRFRAGAGLSPARDVLPDDLLAVYWRCRTNLPAHPGRRQAWEVWNEPDFYFVRDQAHAMAAVLKAVWWGVKAGDPAAEVLMPSLAFRPGRYALELVRNGALNFTDGWNWHFYGWAPEFRPVQAQQREFFRLFGRAFPVWITEAGWFQMPAALAADPALLARQSAFHERLAAEAAAEGVARYLPFALSAYGETQYDLGLTAPDDMPRPALTRYLELTRELAGAAPRWELRRGGEPVGLALERTDGGFWTLLWSPGRPEERVFGSPPRPRAAPLAWSARVAPPDGGAPREIIVTPEANASFTTGTAPFPISGVTWRRWTPAGVPRSAVRAFLRRAADDAGFSADELSELRRGRAPSPVVLQLTPSAGAVNDKAAHAYAVEPGGQVVLRLRLHNFSETPRRGRLTVETPPGWPPRLLHLPGPLEAGPLSALAHELELDVPAGASGRHALRARWEGEDGIRDTALLWLAPRAPLPRRTPLPWRAWQPPLEAPAQWQPFLMDAATLRLEIAAPEGPGRAALAWAPLPRRPAADDVLTGVLRLVRPRPGVYVQPFLVSAAGEQVRHGELEEIPAGGLLAQWRAGDFGPTIWSRVDSFVLPEPRTLRHLVLRFQGLDPGEEVELVDWNLAR